MSTAAGAARAIADVTEGRILATVDIMVPPERVFTALSDGNEIARWWGSPTLYTTDRWTTDFRVGGRWRAEGKGADGTPFFVEGEILEIERPWRIVQTWEPGYDPGLKTRLTFQLSAIDGGTRLVVRHAGLAPMPARARGTRTAGSGCWGGSPPISGQSQGRDTAKYFLARLLGPRPDFARSLSAEEKAMMQAHARYWAPFVENGKVLVLGPVNDPKWTYGVAVLRVESEAELLDLQGKDPAILLGQGGLHYENAPMLAAAWKH